MFEWSKCMSWLRLNRALPYCFSPIQRWGWRLEMDDQWQAVPGALALGLVDRA